MAAEDEPNGHRARAPSGEPTESGPGSVFALADPARFNLAYQEHAAVMRVAATGVLRDSAAAEDVFLSLWHKPESFDPGRGSLGRYLTMMARSRALDRWRTRRVRESAAERATWEARLERRVGEDLAEVVIRRDELRLVLRALATLSSVQRDALLLTFAKGLAFAELAAATQVPLGTAKSRVRVGLQNAQTGLATAA